MSEPTTIALRSPRKIEGLPTGIFQELHLKTHFFGHILEMEDINFHLDSAVLLPDYGSEAPKTGTPDQNRITGLGVLYACYKHAVAHPDQQLLIAGHTDRSGPSDYNLKLSDIRAQNILTALKGDREAWAEISHGRHKVEDYQQILKWIAYTWEWDCDPGPKTGKDNEQTRKATENFQRQYNIELDAFIPINGKVDLPTWGAFFDIYMRELMTLLATNKAGLEAYRSKLTLIKDRPERVGCGEFHPITKDKNKTEIDRRVELLFFDPGEEPELKCHPEAGRCTPKECDLYGSKLYSFKPVDLNPPAPTPPTTTHSIRITKVESPHFIPALEEITIEYEISGPMGRIQNVKLVAESEKEQGRRLFEKDLGVPESPASSTTWKGEATDPDFDGSVNLNSSPYQIWMILTTLSGTSSESNKEKVSVIPEAIEIFVDDKGPATIKDADKEIITNLVAELPKSSSKGSVVIPTPIFKLKSSEMNDDTSFRAYKSEWEWGPSVPFYCRVWLKGKDGKKKRCTKAIVRTKILWDVALEADATYLGTLNERKVDPPARSFLEKVSAYKKTETEPQGRTAHKHFGGLRTTEADRGADEFQWVKINDDWNQNMLAKRSWASYSLCISSGTFDADTGIFFACSRMAGDVHSVTAYIDTNGSLDTKDNKVLADTPATQKSATVTLTTHRRVDVATSYKIGASTVELDLNLLEREYAKAAYVLKPKPGLVTQEVQSQWKKEYQSVVASMAKKSPFVKEAALDDPELFPVRYRDFDDYKKRAFPKGIPSGKVARRAASLIHALTEDEYRKMCERYADDIIPTVAKAFTFGANGLTFFKFGVEGEHNMEKDSITTGVAPTIEGLKDRTRAAFFVFTKGKAGHTLVHEVGHLLFLAHAPGHFNSGDSRATKDDKGNPIEQPGGFQPNAHADNQWCVMSYHKSHPHELCALCLLKLSGWNYTKINKDGSIT